MTIPALSTWENDAGQDFQQKTYFDNTLLANGDRDGKRVSQIDKRISEIDQKYENTPPNLTLEEYNKDAHEYLSLLAEENNIYDPENPVTPEDLGWAPATELPPELAAPAQPEPSILTDPEIKKKVKDILDLIADKIRT